MASLVDAHRLSLLTQGLATVATVRPDGSVQLTVVNAGVVAHPVTGGDVAAFVARGGTRKLEHLRATPTATLLWRAGWSWVALEGRAQVLGPDDPAAGIDGNGVRQLLRDIARASGLPQEDWDEYDRAVAAERRAAVLVTPHRIYQNP